MQLLSKRVASILTGVALLCLTTATHAQTPFSLVKNDVVVFAGGTNMLHLQQAGYLETLLTHKFATARPKFRDLSWEADTVFRQGTVIERWRKVGFGSRDDQLKRVGATVVIAQFGKLESLAGAKGLEKFAKAYGQLIDSYKKQAKQVVLVTPTPFEKLVGLEIPDLSQRNVELALYVKATEKLAAERKLVFVDLFTGAKQGLADNGIHVKPEAQADVARLIAKQLGIANPAQAAIHPLRLAVIEKHRLWYDYWRPANWKLLYGDDSRRQFTRGGNDYIPFREEWKKLIPLIAKAEERVWTIAGGGKDPGHNRPKPEVLHGDKTANIEKELAAFKLPDGLQVNLFASDKEGLTSPLAVRWDPAGRMYVTVTTTYPHVFPGDVPNDKIIVLDDTDGDGKADKSTVFADGLNIPTGMELGDGGVYVGQNTELLFLKDTNGDGKADLRRVVLGGLGNGDSHQTCNSFVWSPGGELYFGQGDGCESRVETPWGAANLYQSGFYRFRPRRFQLHPLLDDFMGPGNPWGVAFGRWGQIFSIDGAGGVTFLTPGQVPVSHRLRLGTIGRPGGYCGIDQIDGRHMPELFRGDFAIGDFKRNQIKRFSVRQVGSGYAVTWKQPILRSSHRNFRPVDVRMGPDGALYIVDWYNPITCHQDDRYRDPSRDKAHGRIWRISAKGSETIRPPNLAKAGPMEMLDALKAPEHWTRYQAKRALTRHDTGAVVKALRRWLTTLDPKDPKYEHHLYEALGAFETIEVVEPSLLDRLLQAKEPLARAYATRVVGRWHDRLNDPLGLLAQRVVDESPQVRLEAVMACAAVPSAKAVGVAAMAMDLPTDRWIDYAFTQAVHHLKPHWLPAFQRGEVAFSRPSHLAAVLSKTGDRDVLGSLKRVADSGSLTPKARVLTIAAILAVGGPGELQEYGLSPKRFTKAGKYDADAHAAVLQRLLSVARSRNVRPAGDLAADLNALIDSASPKIKAHALALAGIWKVEPTHARAVAVAKNDLLPVAVRTAALGAIGRMKLASAKEFLASYATKPHTTAIRAAAIQALVNVDMQVAARHAMELFSNADLTMLDSAATLFAFLEQKNGAAALSTAIAVKKLSPDSAKQLLRSLFSTGRSDPALLAALNQSIGTSAKTPDYSESYVKKLVSDAAKQGDATLGSVVFKNVACISCHKISGAGGTVGPDLTAIGTTLAAERIVEELLWPQRQVKEGYSVVQVITDEGKIHQGYERRTKESQRNGDLVLQELTTGDLMTIKKEQIEAKRVTGSPMPVGLTAVLSRSQLLDLIRYLSELGRIK